MKEISLSYVITTYNKLPYLKQVLSSLLKNVKEDEEVVITDGGSTDGTPEYLKKLFDQGKIHQYVSEKDSGEAHGWNKAWLMAKGKIIKIILDDDVFYYPGIQKCKEFMLKHPEIDILSTDGIFTKAIHESAFINSKQYSTGYFNIISDYVPIYNEWRFDGKPFSFCNLGWMLRKSSIPIFGLCDPTYTRVDAEFSIRASRGKANIAWYTGKTWLRILNPNSNSFTMNKKIASDTERLSIIYPGSHLESEVLQKKWFEFLPTNVQNTLKSLRNAVLDKKETNQEKFIPNDTDWENVFKVRQNELLEINKKETGKFMFKGDGQTKI